MQPTDNEPQWERELIEKVLTENVQEQRRARRWRGFYKFLFISFIIIVAIAMFQKPVIKAHVAQIDLVGSIGQRQDIEADDVLTSLKKAFAEPKVRAIILRINSPGGTPVQSAYIYDELMRLRKSVPEKKVYAIVADICASGAYYIAAGADEIYANPSSIVGSIGVLMPNFGFAEGIKKLGVEQRTLYSGKNKLFLDPFSTENPEQVAFAESLLNDIHQNFIDAVKAGREGKLKNNDEIFSGLFWTGDKALSLGLIDGLGDAEYVKREIIGLEETEDYTVSTSIFEKLTTRLGTSAAKQLATEVGLNHGLARLF